MRQAGQVLRTPAASSGRQRVLRRFDLERAIETLERRLRERTEELTAANVALSAQIEERKNAEEAYRELFENADDMVFTLDLAGEFTSLNKVGEQLTGYTRAAIAERKLDDVVSAADQPAVGEALADLQRDGTPAKLIVDIKHEDASRTKVELGLRLTQRAGTSIAIHGVARDITVRERLEFELRQAQKLEAIGQLAGGVAHDFNNLLMVIQGYSEMLLSRPLDQGRRDDLQQIHTAATRGSELTRQLLAFGRKQMLRVIPLDLNTVVLETSQLLRRLIGENISLRIDPSEDLCAIEADRTQLEQVLMNLAVNARDAMSRGGALTIKVGRVQLAERTHALPEGSYVTLTVRDTGCGMDETTRQRVFEPFFTTKAPGKGSGLGLATVHGVVKQLGGDVTVESTPLQGTAFNVFLPATTKTPEVVHWVTIPNLVTGNNETVLLVEDDAPVRTLLTAMLRRHGYNALEAAGPREALLVAARHTGTVDLLISDVVMPEMTGPEMVALMKNLRCEPPVLYLSGYASDALVIDQVLPQSTLFVQKPVSTRQLLEAVRQALEPPALVSFRAS
jgi:two-component system, cell cycle sensor histidine kinase and response regulator CckA